MEQIEIKEVEENLNIFKAYLQTLPEKALGLGSRVLLAILFFAVGTQCIRLIRSILRKSLKRANADLGVMQFLDSFIKVGAYILLIFLIATSFGVDATSVVALLGSAGVAIGLAVQGSLSNFVGGVLILLLKPFRVGDYIIEDSKKNEGTVDEIQIFYTKLKTPDDKVIILPNGTLANTSLTNVTATQVRRLDVKVGISYQADLKAAKDVLFGLLVADQDVLKDMERVVFVDELGQSAVVLNVRCWFRNEDFWPGKWRITEQIKLALDDAGIEIPYPQLYVHLPAGEEKRYGETQVKRDAYETR